MFATIADCIIGEADTTLFFYVHKTVASNIIIGSGGTAFVRVTLNCL